MAAYMRYGYQISDRKKRQSIFGLLWTGCAIRQSGYDYAYRRCGGRQRHYSDRRLYRSLFSRGRACLDGAVFTIEIIQTSSADFIAWTKGWGGEIIGTALLTSKDYRKANWQKPLILLMGNEQAGLTHDLAPPPASLSVCNAGALRQSQPRRGDRHLFI